MTLDDYLRTRRDEVEAALDELVPKGDVRPSTIHQAMRHSLFAGGKRIRPVLFLAAAEAVGVKDLEGVRAACSLELIHTYSLIHDDLPALDNDDFRRGRPTAHKVFGEAMAILAGDALLTRAFEVLAGLTGPADRRIALVRDLATAAGTVDGMIGGQVADLEAEGKPVEEERLLYIHRSKTGALIRASVRMGGIWAGCSDEQLTALDEYGRRVGMAFQIVDDILDVTATSEELGKTAGKDAEQEKATYPALYGLEESRRLAAEQYRAAIAAAEVFGERGLRLREIAQRVVARSN